MTRIPLFQIDAFTGRVFSGNPAAVCPLDTWPEDWILQSIASENNLSETAFFVEEPPGYRLRWFTPVAEVDLCGHATLAAAYCLFECLGFQGETIRFETRSGPLAVRRDSRGFSMDFPVRPPAPVVPVPRLLEQALARKPEEVLLADDYVAVFSDERDIRSLAPDPLLLKQLDARGVCVTAPGTRTDFVSRFFAPKFGIDEDPVTGSAHCELAPYWAARLGRARLTAFQCSDRGGEILCELRGNRVHLIGNAALYLRGEIFLPPPDTGPTP